MTERRREEETGRRRDLPGSGRPGRVWERDREAGRWGEVRKTKGELRPTTKRWIVREQVGLTNKTKRGCPKDSCGEIKVEVEELMANVKCEEGARNRSKTYRKTCQSAPKAFLAESEGRVKENIKC